MVEGAKALEKERFLLFPFFFLKVMGLKKKKKKRTIILSLYLEGGVYIMRTNTLRRNTSWMIEEDRLIFLKRVISTGACGSEHLNLLFQCSMVAYNAASPLLSVSFFFSLSSVQIYLQFSLSCNRNSNQIRVLDSVVLSFYYRVQDASLLSFRLLHINHCEELKTIALAAASTATG